MEEMRNEAEAQKLVPAVSVREIFTNPTLRIPLIIAVMMMLAQQFSGINAVSPEDSCIKAIGDIKEQWN